MIPLLEQTQAVYLQALLAHFQTFPIDRNAHKWLEDAYNADFEVLHALAEKFFQYFPVSKEEAYAQLKKTYDLTEKLWNDINEWIKTEENEDIKNEMIQSLGTIKNSCTYLKSVMSESEEK